MEEQAITGILICILTFPHQKQLTIIIDHNRDKFDVIHKHGVRSLCYNEIVISLLVSLRISSFFIQALDSTSLWNVYVNNSIW